MDFDIYAMLHAELFTFIPKFKLSDKADKKTVEKLRLEAIEQLNKYEDDSLVTVYTNEGILLKKVVLIFHGWEMLVCEEV